jgi:hypothetical protein
MTDIRVISKKRVVRITKSVKKSLSCSAVKVRYPTEIITRLKKNSGREFLKSDFTWIFHLIKSLTAV